MAFGKSIVKSSKKKIFLFDVFHSTDIFNSGTIRVSWASHEFKVVFILSNHYCNFFYFNSIIIF